MFLLNEFSINNLLSRVGSSLASELTRYFSQERRVKYKMGNTPRFTKLVDTFYDQPNDSITFTFMTYATPKPDPNNVEVKQQVDPLRNFRKDINNLQVYEIMLRFFNVSRLMGEEQASSDNKVRKSRAKSVIPKGLLAKSMASIADEPEKDSESEASIDDNFVPYEDDDTKDNLPESVVYREARVSAEEAKNWLFNTDFAIWSNSPSFHWQGFNYNLSQLSASMFPTTIAPQSGKRGWKDKHGNALVDKHLLELFVYIKFFVGQMASSLLNKVRSSRKENSVVNLIKRGILLSESKKIKREDSDVMSEFRSDEFVGYVTLDNTFKYGIMELSYKGSEADYKLNFVNKPLSTEQRVRLFNSVNSDEDSEVTNVRSVSFSAFGKPSEDTYEGFSEEEFTPELLEHISSALYSYIQDTSPDIFSIHIDEMDVQGKFLTSLFKELTSVCKQDYKVEKSEYSSHRFVLSLIKNEKYGYIFGDKLTEAEDDIDMEGPKPPSPGEDDSEDSGESQAQESDVEEEASKPEKIMVCCVGAFLPVTHDHSLMVDKTKQVAEENGTIPVIGLTSLKGFEADETSTNAKVRMLKDMFPECKVVGEYGEVDSFYSFLVWASSQNVTKLILVCPTDKHQYYTEILYGYNGNLTIKGKFDFQEYEVVSSGQSDPDYSTRAVKARNAITDKDINSFANAIYKPFSNSAKNLAVIRKMYKILDYESVSIGI